MPLTCSRILPLACLCFLAAAAPPVGASEVSERRLAELGDPQWSVRERAMFALLADSQLQDEDLAAMYTSATMPEQRHRLLTVARHRFLARLMQEQFPQRSGGSMGILLLGVPEHQMSHLGRPAVRVARTLPGFPAFVQLRAGDLILAIGDQPLPGNIPPDELREYFIRRIQNQFSGETLHLTVQRDGQTLTLPLQLVSREALVQVYPADEAGQLMEPYRALWREQVRKLTGQDQDGSTWPIDWPTVPQPPSEPPDQRRLPRAE